jgi:hypothetical protein
MFLRRHILVVVDNYRDILLKNVLLDRVILVYELFVLRFDDGNCALGDEGDVHELIQLNEVLQLHDVSVAKKKKKKLYRCRYFNELHT